MDVITNIKVENSTDADLKPTTTKFKICVVTALDKSPRVELDVYRFDTIFHVKTLIQDKLGIQPNQQTLLYNGKELKDKKALSAYRIRNFKTLFLIVGPDDSFQINVEIMDDGVKTMKVDVRSWYSVKDVKLRIVSMGESDRYGHRLDGREMVDGKTLADYNIVNMQTLTLVHTDMQVFVRVLDGSSIILNVRGCDIVEYVMRRVEERTGVPVKGQRLVCGITELYHNLTLNYCNVKNHSNIHLLLRLRSCKISKMLPATHVIGGTTVVTRVANSSNNYAPLSDFIADIKSNSNNDPMVVGLHIDFTWGTYFNSGTGTVTLCRGKTCVAVDFHATGYEKRPSRFCTLLVNFVKDSDIYFVGVDIHNSMGGIGMKCRNAVELRDLAVQILGRPRLGVLNVLNLAWEVVGLHVAKPSREISDRLSRLETTEYTTTHAYAAFIVGERLISLDTKKVKVEAP